MANAIMTGTWVIIASAFCLTTLAWADGITRPAQFGEQTSINSYRARLVPIRTIDFENGLADITVISGAVVLTSSSSEVLSGQHSLKLSGANAFFQINPQALGLEPFKTYIVEYDYRILRRSDPTVTLRVAVLSSGKPQIDIGRGPLQYNTGSGSSATGIRVGDAAGATFGFYTVDADVLIDNIRVSRHDASMQLSHPALWTFGFPRVAIYNLTTPEETALRTQLSLEETETRLSRYDLLTGSDIDSTLGAAAWVTRLRRLNPNLKILPYHESFVAHVASPLVLDGAADLNAMFNSGLPQQWYMVNPSGQKLIEPDYPANIQLDLTRYCPVVDNATMIDYEADYISKSVMPSGLWDGVHFDQPEWYPNPLLAKKDTTDPIPPIDLERNGQAASAALLHVSWLEGFYNYFQYMSSRFGFGALMFGNAGYIAGNTNVVPVLNGWLREIASPYTIDDHGDWNTADAAGWYRLATNYLIADQFTRAPSSVMEQFTGRGLGQATGTFTANGLPNRTPALEVRDYRRMRFGLTTTLLGNGFFTYALIDNTTAAPWFDEYAVDANGAATTDLAGKHYLGQPLGNAVELDYPTQFIFNVDFENPDVPPYFQPSASRRITFDPKEVIQGKFSMVISRDDTDPRGLIFSTDPSLLKLQRGKTYQLFMDYKILDYQPRTFLGMLGIGISGATQGLTEMRTGSLYLPDTFGTGQTGTLRSSVKVTEDGYIATGALTDFGTVSVDNIRLVEGTGGVWRRDFENGIVLVNPTPEDLTVSLAQAAGPLGRTGLRRIRGMQAPLINSGQAITGPITIPSGDGLILLADRILAPAPGVPENVTGTANSSGVWLTWKPATGTVAGYLIRYGEDIAMPSREATAGPSAQISLAGLATGTQHYFRVGAFDFKGNLSAFSAPLAMVTAGDADRRPQLFLGSDTPVLAPGALASITGSQLADAAVEGQVPYSTILGGSSVEVNGVKVPLLFVSPDRIEFQVPWNLAGTDAILTVHRGGVASGDRVVPVASALPQLAVVNETNLAEAIRMGVNAWQMLQPVRSGDVIAVKARGLGLAEPPPDDGTLPAPNRARIVTAPVQAQLDGVDIPVLWAVLSTTQPGAYNVYVVIPADIAPGLKPLRITMNGISSNDAYVVIGGSAQ
jgi:uncharacterized protein (TIGR03437 family)